MAPEQCDNSHAVDIRADIYSLGCTLYHLLAGSPPFAALAFRLRIRSSRPMPRHRRRRSANGGRMSQSNWQWSWRGCWPRIAMIGSPPPRKSSRPCIHLRPARTSRVCFAPKAHGFHRWPRPFARAVGRCLWECCTHSRGRWSSARAPWPMPRSWQSRKSISEAESGGRNSRPSFAIAGRMSRRLPAKPSG